MADVVNNIALIEPGFTLPESLPLSAELLAGERDRLVRFCLRFTGGNLDVAEDLTQETMIEALRSAERLRDREAWRAWLSGIARNVCLRWARRHAQEIDRITHFPNQNSTDADGDGPVSPIVLVEAGELDAALEQEEMTRLLDRAMNRIPERMRDILIEHYVDDLPQAEIAARRGIREETVAVQMHRGRKALRDALLLGDLRQEAAELGLITDTSSLWQETHIWCPDCGRRRLMGRFDAGSDRSGAFNEFILRCPDCNADTDSLFTNMRYNDDARLADVLRGVKGFKPALNRLSTWWYSYYTNALETGYARCLVCNRTVTVALEVPADIMTTPEGFPLRGVFVRCPHCDTFCYADVGVLGLWQPSAQEFWRKHGRIRFTPTREISMAGGGAYLTRVESVTSSEVMDIITSRETMEIIEIKSGGR